jgi:hypothetical protein
VRSLVRFIQLRATLNRSADPAAACVPLAQPPTVAAVGRFTA